MQVAIRQLKAKLPENVERAASGEIVIITNRGQPVAQLVPIHGRGNIERGLAEGWITRDGNRPPKPFEPVPPRPGTSSTLEILRQDRDG